MRKKNLCYGGVKALDLRSSEFPVPGCVQRLVGYHSELPGLVKGIQPMAGVGAR